MSEGVRISRRESVRLFLRYKSRTSIYEWVIENVSVVKQGG